jgi:hypothetical protein
MAWRRRDRRGRPRKADKVAKRRATTTARRAPEVDLGSARLRARKRAVTGREDLELNGAAVLFGHGHIDREQYDTLAEIRRWLEAMARAWGGLGGVTGLWYAITGAAVPTGFARRQDAGLAGLADGARRRLQRICRGLDGSRDLVIELAEGKVPVIVVHASTAP